MIKEKKQSKKNLNSLKLDSKDISKDNSRDIKNFLIYTKEDLRSPKSIKKEEIESIGTEDLKNFIKLQGLRHPSDSRKDLVEAVYAFLQTKDTLNIRDQNNPISNLLLNIPTLKAKVHKRITAEDLDSMDIEVIIGEILNQGIKLPDTPNNKTELIGILLRYFNSTDNPKESTDQFKEAQFKDYLNDSKVIKLDNSSLTLTVNELKNINPQYLKNELKHQGIIYSNSDEPSELADKIVKSINSGKIMREYTDDFKNYLKLIATKQAERKLKESGIPQNMKSDILRTDFQRVVDNSIINNKPLVTPDGRILKPDNSNSNIAPKFKIPVGAKELPSIKISTMKVKFGNIVYNVQEQTVYPFERVENGVIIVYYPLLTINNGKKNWYMYKRQDPGKPKQPQQIIQQSPGQQNVIKQPQVIYQQPAAPQVIYQQPAAPQVIYQQPAAPQIILPGGFQGHYPSGFQGQYPSGFQGQNPSGLPGQNPSGLPGQYSPGLQGQYPWKSDLEPYHDINPEKEKKVCNEIIRILRDIDDRKYADIFCKLNAFNDNLRIEGNFDGLKFIKLVDGYHIFEDEKFIYVITEQNQLNLIKKPYGNDRHIFYNIVYIPDKIFYDAKDKTINFFDKDKGFFHLKNGNKEYKDKPLPPPPKPVECPQLAKELMVYLNIGEYTCNNDKLDYKKYEKYNIFDIKRSGNDNIYFFFIDLELYTKTTDKVIIVIDKNDKLTDIFIYNFETKILYTNIDYRNNIKFINETLSINGEDIPKYGENPNNSNTDKVSDKKTTSIGIIKDNTNGNICTEELLIHINEITDDNKFTRNFVQCDKQVYDKDYENNIKYINFIDSLSNKSPDYKYYLFQINGVSEGLFEYIIIYFPSNFNLINQINYKIIYTSSNSLIILDNDYKKNKILSVNIKELNITLIDRDKNIYILDINTNTFYSKKYSETITEEGLKLLPNDLNYGNDYEKIIFELDNLFLYNIFNPGYDQVSEIKNRLILDKNNNIWIDFYYKDKEKNVQSLYLYILDKDNFLVTEDFNDFLFIFREYDSWKEKSKGKNIIKFKDDKLTDYKDIIDGALDYKINKDFLINYVGVSQKLFSSFKDYINIVNKDYGQPTALIDYKNETEIMKDDEKLVIKNKINDDFSYLVTIINDKKITNLSFSVNDTKKEIIITLYDALKILEKFTVDIINYYVIELDGHLIIVHDVNKYITINKTSDDADSVLESLIGVITYVNNSYTNSNKVYTLTKEDDNTIDYNIGDSGVERTHIKIENNSLDPYFYEYENYLILVYNNKDVYYLDKIDNNEIIYGEVNMSFIQPINNLSHKINKKIGKLNSKYNLLSQELYKATVSDDTKSIFDLRKVLDSESVKLISKNILDKNYVDNIKLNNFNIIINKGGTGSEDLTIDRLEFEDEDNDSGINTDGVIQDTVGSIFDFNGDILKNINYNSKGSDKIMYSTYNRNNTDGTKFRILKPLNIKDGEAIISGYGFIDKLNRIDDIYNTNIIHTKTIDYSKDNIQNTLPILINNYINTINLFLTYDNGKYANTYDYKLKLSLIKDVEPVVNMFAISVAHMYLEQINSRNLDKIRYEINVSRSGSEFNKIYDLFRDLYKNENTDDKVLIKYLNTITYITGGKQKANIITAKEKQQLTNSINTNVEKSIIDIKKFGFHDKDIINVIEKEKHNIITNLRKSSSTGKYSSEKIGEDYCNLLKGCSEYKERLTEFK